jgi:hypothetical protein
LAIEVITRTIEGTVHIRFISPIARPKNNQDAVRETLAKAAASRRYQAYEEEAHSAPVRRSSRWRKGDDDWMPNWSPRNGGRKPRKRNIRRSSSLGQFSLRAAEIDSEHRIALDELAERVVRRATESMTV